MTRLMLALGLLIGGNLLSFPVNTAAAEKINVLLLFADDQRTDTIHAWGNPHIQTPNLDRLVHRGLSFRNNYCYGSNSPAVCIPSRAMLHTSKTWLHSNNQMEGEVTLGEHFREHGYTTFATGKWHNGPASLLRSFEQGEHVFMGGMFDHTRVPISRIDKGKLIKQGIGEEFSSELFADAAIEFLKNQSADKPFLAYVAFTAPHDPRNPPEKYREKYYKNPPPAPMNFQPFHALNTGSLTIRDEMLAPWPRTEEVVQEQLCEYYGLVTHMDEQIGRILKALEKSPHAKNTLIIYAADHGLAMGSHGLMGKQSLYEHSMKCPLIITGPQMPGGFRSEALTYLHDIYPTLCKMTGLPIPDGLDGKDLTPLWLSSEKKVREVAFLPYDKHMRSVRDDRWKLIVYPQINHRQLFDLENDPQELWDLSDVPAYADQLARMKELLKQSQAEAGDDLPLTTESPQPATLDLTDRPRKPDPHQPEWIRKKYFPKAAQSAE